MTFDPANKVERMYGFGNASTFIADQFWKSGLEFLKTSEALTTQGADSMVNLAFCYPNEFQFLDNQYKIAFFPWESTLLQPGWTEILEGCDEIWTTSEWSKSQIDKCTGRNSFVYEHGISKSYAPKKRRSLGDVVRFLHIGEPHFRKNAQAVVSAFAEMYGNNPRYQLIIKSTGINTTRILDQYGNSMGSPNSLYNNIIIIEDNIDAAQMKRLYELTDIFIYPSMGEGFGFNAAQSIAMSIPTICTSEWAPYAEFITAPLDGEYVDSPWPEMHPGQLVQPDIDQMKFYMKDMVDNYKFYGDMAFKNSLRIHEKFSWDRVSELPIKKIKKIILMTSK
jgi:glycosyltransferase involved in cell wall biosynthesis